MGVPREWLPDRIDSDNTRNGRGRVFRIQTGATQLVSGQFSHDDCCFFLSNEALGSVADRIGLLHRTERRVVRGCEGEANTTLFLVDGMVAAVVCGRRLRVQWLEEARRDAGGLESLRDFISLPRDEEGRTGRSQGGVGDGAGHARRGDPFEQLVMPRIALSSLQTALRNHPSWEKDEDAKRALGRAFAKWLATGVLEYVAWDDRMPVLLQPCGAVPKGTAPFYRLITDARFAN